MTQSDSRWPEVALGDFCEFKYGRSLPESARSGGPVPVYGSNGIVGAHHAAITSGPTIVVGRKGSYGEVNFSGMACWPIDTTYFVDGTTTKADLRWLRHVLPSLGLNTMNKAAAVPGLNRDDAYRARVVLPPLPEQRRIATILDQAETLRVQRRAAISQLNSFGQAIFRVMFGDPVSNSRGLLVRSLGELVKLKSGEFLPAAAMSTHGEIPVFGGNGVNGYHDEAMFQTSQIVIGRVGAYCGCVHVTPQKSWVTDNALFVAARDESVDLDYLAVALNLAKLNQYSSQSGQPLVSASRLYPVKILVPPLELQRDFAGRVQSAEKLSAVQRIALARLDELFISLQHRAFRGELMTPAPARNELRVTCAGQLESTIGLEALIFVVKRMPAGRHHHYKSLKALYFADKHHLEKHGRLIYGETHCALPHGPVPQAAYDATRVLNGERLISDFDDEALRAGLSRIKDGQQDKLVPLRDADFSKLGHAERESLEWAIRYCADMSFEQVKAASHDTAYERTPANAPIPIEYMTDMLPPGA